MIRPTFGGGIPSAHEFFKTRCGQFLETRPSGQITTVSEQEGFKQRIGSPAEETARVLGNVEEQFEIVGRLLDAHMGCNEFSDGGLATATTADQSSSLAETGPSERGAMFRRTCRLPVVARCISTCYLGYLHQRRSERKARLVNSSPRRNPLQRRFGRGIPTSRP